MNPLHIEQLGSGPRVVFIHGGEEAGGAAAFAAQTHWQNHIRCCCRICRDMGKHLHRDLLIRMWTRH